MSNSDRKAGLCVMTTIALLVGVDHWLYGTRWFLRQFGYGTQEGQIVAKLDRAPLHASVADVIFLGSSTIRANIASRPFLDAGVLPLNLGISGGGPIYDYYALKSVADVLARRSVEPLLVIELSGLTLQPAPGTAWSEYEHLFSAVRSRAELAGDFPRLLANFRSYHMTSVFLSGVILPSTMYRSVSRSVGSLPLGEIPSMVTVGRGSNVAFYGFDDPWGFAPLYGRAANAQPAHTREIASVVPAKREFLRATLDLARRLGLGVVLLESSATSEGRPPKSLFDELQGSVPGTRVIRFEDCDFHPEDFYDSHLNIWGAERLATRLVRLLGLKGNRQSLDRKQALLLDRLPVPQPGSPFEVVPDVPHILEFEAAPTAGKVCVSLGPTQSKWMPSYNATMACTPENVEPAAAARFYLRFRPRSPRAVVRITGEGAGGESSVRLVSFVRQR